MARVIYSANALANLTRLFEFLAEREPESIAAAATAIRDVINLLAQHPLMGRRIEGELRELVISYGKTGYVALYRFVPARAEIRILALRHQRELDYQD